MAENADISRKLAEIFVSEILNYDPFDSNVSYRADNDGGLVLDGTYDVPAIVKACLRTARQEALL